jgi:hypothetical protein
MQSSGQLVERAFEKNPETAGKRLNTRVVAKMKIFSRRFYGDVILLLAPIFAPC